MIRRLLAWSVALLLITSAEARERTPLEQAKRIPRGSKVTVVLKDQNVVRGRLGQVTETQFTLEPVKAGVGTQTDILFRDVWKFRPRKSQKLKLLLVPVLLPLWAIGLAVNAPLVAICAVKKNCSVP